MVQKNISLDVYTFNTIIHALCKEGRFMEAKDMYDKMLERGQKPDVVTFGALIKGYIFRNQVKKAKMLFDNISKKWCRT